MYPYTQQQQLENDRFKICDWCPVCNVAMVIFTDADVWCMQTET